MMYLPSAVLLGLFAVNGMAMSPPELVARDNGTQYTYNSTGNTIITFSDDTINLGSVGVQDIFNKLQDLCSNGGQCDTREATMSGSYATTGEVYDEEILLDASGDYPAALHDALLAALQNTINSVAQTVTVHGNGECFYPPSECPSGPIDDVNQTVVPAFWGIQYKDPNDSDAAPPFINLALSQELETGSGFCETFATIGGAVAGSVNGVAGGIFSLLGLLCNI